MRLSRYNIFPLHTMLKEYADEIKKLKDALKAKRAKDGGSLGKSGTDEVGTHALEQGIIDIEDLKKFDRLKALVLNYSIYLI